MTPRIGLYYPYVHFRSDEWLKGAALYRPRLARVVPARYPVADSATVLALVDELDFVVNVDPAPAVTATSALLADAVEAHATELREQGRAPARPGEQRWAAPVWRENPERVFTEAAWLPSDRTAQRLRQALTHAGLQAGTRAHPDVVWVYLCALAERLAVTNLMEPMTDQVAAHSATHGWTADRMAAALLGRAGSVPPDLATRVGLLAVQVVVPRSLAGVAVEKIVRVRRKYGADFEAFHDTIRQAATDLGAEFAACAEPEALDAYLRQKVAGRFRGPLADLTAALRGAGLDTALTAAAVKVELPATAGPVGGSPVLAGTAAAAVGLATTARPRQVRRAPVAPSPVSFLWNVDRCTARGLLRRVLA